VSNRTFGRAGRTGLPLWARGSRAPVSRAAGPLVVTGFALARAAGLRLAALCVSALAAAPVLAAPAQEPAPAPPKLENLSRERLADVPAELDREAALQSLDASMDYLIGEQKPDGSYGSGALEGLHEMGFSVETYYCWQYASHGLAILALLRADETPERLQALEQAITWLLAARVPKRGSNWDVDYSWSALYGFVAAVELLSDPRFLEHPRRAELTSLMQSFWTILERNEAPSGGWAYYDDPPYKRRPDWATSFCTALVLPAIDSAHRRGWIDGQAQVRRGLAALRRSALPNGAYNYDASNAVPRIGGGEHINNVKGSLGRIQVCQWARMRLGDPGVTHDDLRRGLEQFFEHHRFLDVARMRPIPHEAYYANAGYFYIFAHFYAAEVIELLPVEERESWHRRLRPHLTKIQWADGSSTDFLGTSYLRTAGTAMSAYALQLGLDDPQ
jgi:hypothetical protein